MIETKAIESKIFLQKIDKLTKDVKILMDNMTACALCSSYEHAEIECPRFEGLMAMNDRVRPSHYNNYNNQNYKRGNGNTYQPLFHPQTNFQSTQRTHPTQNEVTLATNELLKQMLTEMERMKMMMGGQSQQSYTTLDKQKGKIVEAGSSDREAGQFPTQLAINPQTLHFSVNKHYVHEVNSKEVELETLHTISRLRNGKNLPDPYELSEEIEVEIKLKEKSSIDKTQEKVE
ncbi:unnamed protein product [Spirodela intermedia]|uniref:Uncharacterized protein n=2 Tax=Spirodela intermedia TaxID=51605 RepID=A0A7I8JER6_SPIIN|nr:unnamed protein product [Spirodela intermedia]CAA6668658.1 unnamed protein product [Spirodela intermedia]CAA7405541.1 unnamed protein product [Spirodela intermedia]